MEMRGEWDILRTVVSHPSPATALSRQTARVGSYGARARTTKEFHSNNVRAVLTCARVRQRINVQSEHHSHPVRWQNATIESERVGRSDREGPPRSHARTRQYWPWLNRRSVLSIDRLLSVCPSLSS